jgi:retron-type reverse transcriptase
MEIAKAFSVGSTCFKKRSGILITGAGLRGGNWNNDATNARTSDRNNAANTNSNRNNNYGGRCVNTSLLMEDREQKVGKRIGRYLYRPSVFYENVKKISNIYPAIIAKENLYQSAYMASRGRRYRDTTADFNFSLEEEIGRLHKELLSKTYCHGKYRLFTIYDPKKRKIAAAPFRDRVVHHAVHDVIEPIIDKTFIYDSYACRKDKGTHKAVDRAQGFLRANGFCFHGDIKQYFPSISRRILKRILRMMIEDKDLLWLLDEIIDSAAFLPYLPLQVNEIGLPIGNLTSQFLANLYLNGLDYFIKFDLRIRYYLRYMDDFLIFSNEKTELTEIKEKIRKFLNDSLELRLHEDKSQIYSTSGGIKFLGFRLFFDRRRITSDNVRRFRKRINNFEYLFANGQMTKTAVKDSVRCWTAHSKYANTAMLRKNILDELVKEKSSIVYLLKDLLVA